MNQPTSILGLDIGSVRVGVSRAVWPDGIPSRLTVLTNDLDLSLNLARLIEQENASLIVAGLPRSLEGNETNQTRATLEQIERLRVDLKVPIYLQDEAATSLKAEAELKTSGKEYAKEDIDALSAIYILDDFINEHPKGANLD